jgi:hypothetical protein
MSGMSLLDYAEAMERKKAAIDTVAANSSEWMALALIELERMINSFPESFAGEFIRVKLTPWIGKPHSPNAWGALTRTALNRKLIEPTGQWTPMLAEKSHGRQTPLYRKRSQ